MKKSIFLCLIFLTFDLYSQNSDFENASYNIGVASIGSAIGAVINKKPEEKVGKVFLKGLWQGSIGGAVIYGSKKIVSEIPKSNVLEYNWAAKIVNAAGVSIVENSANNKDFWEVWHLNIGFNRLEFHTKEKFRFRYKILPISFALTLGTAINKKPQWNLMLRSGEIVFSSKNINSRRALTVGQAIILEDNLLSDNQTLAHEFIHVYQYNDFNFVSQYFNKPIEGFRTQSSFFNYLDNFIHWDLHAPILGGLYQIEELSGSSAANNFFEREARFYSPDRLNSLVLIN